MVVKNANIHNIMGGMESTGGVRLHNHRRKLKQRFDIIRKLGQGTYGKVQLGINKETGQEVAIKTIKKAKIETEADLIRIRREIQIMSSVQHPNIIHIYEVFENREKMVLVMEYAAGGELYDYLSERKVLPQDEARRIFRQIATAVFYCHKHKICHRDLKLENILLDEHGSAKIADFGLSNVFDEQRLLNTFCGSPLYASPEIVKGTPYHGPEVDCWSLGVLLYTLVYGAMPFDGSNFKRLVKQISQGDYFEPKKPSPASSLIRDMLTVSPAKRADIEKVCSHWWVNEGYSDSCLQIAEELADQTPVRLDLLLSLAPPPSGVGTENIMQQGMGNSASVPHAIVPTRCHSVGSLMELDHTATEQQQQQPQRAFGAIGKQPLYGDSVAQSTQSTSCATTSHWDSTKRKLEEGASSSEVNLRGAVKRDRGKRKSYEGNADIQMSSGKPKHSGENEMEEQTSSEVHQEEEKMDIEEISDSTLSGAAHIPESMESSGLSKDSGVETQEDSLNTTELEPTCKSSTVSSTATIIPVDELASALPSPDEHISNEPTLSDNSKSKKSIKKKVDSVNDLKMSGDLLKDLERSRSAITNDKKDSVVVKEPSKGGSGTKEKQKKGASAEANEMSKTSKTVTKNDTGNATNKNSKLVESVVNSSKNTSASGGKDEKENESLKSSTKCVKSKGDLVLENLNSEASSTPNTSEPSTPPAGTMERRRSKIFETADKFNSILSGSPETKNATREKPKKLFIPGVKVSDFKKAFERKLSSPEISVAAFSKKYPTKSDETTSEKSEKTQNGENENNVNGIQKVTSQTNEVHENNVKAKPPGTIEGEQVQEDLKGKKSKTAGKSSSYMTEDNKKENTLDSNKTKSVKTPSENKKSSKSVINKSSDSAADGKSLETTQPASITVESTDLKTKTENDKAQELLHNEKKSIQSETVISGQDAGNEVTVKPSSKPNETAGKKKSSKVEITLKSATLPRRKTSKAEIKLDPAIPPVEYKTEIEHMVNTPTTVPLHLRRSDEEHAVPESTPPFRSWSLEPESPHLGKMSSRECIIPIQIERETREGSNLTSPPVGRPPAYPFQQRSMSQSQRSSTLSRQSTQESDSEVMEPIRKSPREYIIPIAVEGGGYVTPRAGSLEPSASNDDAKSRRSMSSSTRSNHYRRMSSLLSDTSEDEGFNMSPGGLQRHGSLSRGRDDGRTFHFHRLRSSRPMRHSLEHNDSLSSAEEDDDDDDDEGFEILTAESLFSTLLSRVRSLTQRLTVEDGKRPGFPSNHFVNQLSNISNPSTSFKNFYSHHREPLSRRLSETSSFPRLLNRGGDFGPMHQRSLSRDSSNCDSVNSEASCTVGSFPRGPSNQKYNPCDNIRRGTRNTPSSYQYASGVPRGAGWQTKYSDDPNTNNSYLLPESSVMKSSSSGKNISKLPSHSNQSHMYHSPRKLTRTLSLRSTAEDKLFCNSPVEENLYNKYSDGYISDKHNSNIDLQIPIDPVSTTPNYKREKLRSSSRQNLTSLSRDFKSLDSASGYILPPLPQSSVPESKCNSIPRPIHNISRIPGQEIFNKRSWGTKNMRIDNYQSQPKHSSSLPSIVEGPKSLKYKGNVANSNSLSKPSELQGAYNSTSSTEIKKLCDKKLNNTENSASKASLIHKNAQTEMKSLQNSYDGEELTKNNQIVTSQPKDTQSSRAMTSTAGSQSRSVKSGKPSMIPKSSSGLKQGKDSGNVSVPETTDKDDGCTVQKRRISRFLRPDFFDTPPEESTYVKEREAKKAAEAEIKKAKRLARRTSSMRETSIAKTDTHDKSNSNASERAMPVIKNDNKTISSFSKNSDVHLANLEDRNEKMKSNSKISSSSSHLDDKSNKNQTWNSPQKGDILRTSGSGLCASAKSRVGKAISSLQEHNFTPWDKKVVATESTYLKRAVSVDDVSLKSQGSLTKSNPKLGRKISSVLGLFSKMDNPALDNQYPSNTVHIQNNGDIDKNFSEHPYLQNEVKPNSPSTNSLDKGKNKLDEKKQLLGTNFCTSEAENGSKSMKQPKSLKDSKYKVDLKKNNKKAAAQVISDALCNTKDSTKKTLLKSNPPDFNSKNASSQKSQEHQVDAPHDEEINKKLLPSNSSQLSDHIDESSNFLKSITDNIIPTTMVSSLVSENCEQPSILAYKDNTFPLVNDASYFSKVTNTNSENSPVDETESVDSWCASSDIDPQENLGLPGDDDDDKESESVEDRIRRKSFYSRFNDVKKKGRKKSSQFLKDCRSTLLPGNYHKNDNQAFLPQSNNTGAIGKKLPISPPTTETHKVLGNTNNTSINSTQNPVPVSNKTNELCNLDGKDERNSEKNRILDNVSTEASDSPTNTCALLRPAAFAQSVLKKTSPVKGKTQTQSQDGSTSIPKLSDQVSSTSNAVITSENTNQKKELSTS